MKTILITNSDHDWGFGTGAIAASLGIYFGMHWQMWFLGGLGLSVLAITKWMRGYK